MRVNRKSLKVITAPTGLAVSIQDMALYLRIDTNDEDDLIESFIRSATESVKQYLRRSILTETLELTIDGFGDYGEERLLSLGSGVHTGALSYYTNYGGEFDLPFLPIQSITSIKTYDTSNTESTFPSSSYSLDETGGRVYLNDGYSFPSNLRNREAVKVRYVAGYGDTGASVPDPILQAIRYYVSSMYDCRSACEMPEQCVNILSPYRLIDNMGFC